MFADRIEAGQRLGRALARFRADNPVVYGLPRGGVPVAAEVARLLDAPLDVLIVRKIGAPGQRELAMGAVVGGPEPVTVWNEDIVHEFGLTPAEQEAAVAAEMPTIHARERDYFAGRARPPVAGRPAIVVDDGLATGATARAALRGLRAMHPARIVLAVPVAPPEALEALRGEADEVIALEQPAWFSGVGAFYADFAQTTDADVMRCLAEHPAPAAPGAGEAGR